MCGERGGGRGQSVLSPPASACFIVDPVGATGGYPSAIKRMGNSVSRNKRARIVSDDITNDQQHEG